MENQTSEIEPEKEVKQSDSVEQIADEKSLVLLTRNDQKIVAAVCLFLLLWAGWRWVDLSRWGNEEIEIRNLSTMKTSYLIDINDANWLEYAMLDGIGEVLAKRIIEYRDEQGPFTSVQDLRNVKGIGKKTFEKIEPHLVLRKPSGELNSKIQE